MTTTINDTDLDADLIEMIADYPQSITFGGAAYACVAESLSEGHDNSAEAGYFGQDGLAIHVRTALFTTRPVTGKTLTYRTRTMRITGVSTTPDDLELILNCEEETA